MDRNIGESITINQTTGIGHVVGIVLDDFPLKNAEEDFI